MTSHDLKVWPPFFDAIADNRKLFELRKDDRAFKVGDWLKLREWKPPNILTATKGHYTGQRCLRRISYVLRPQDIPVGTHNAVTPPLKHGFVILGLQPPISEIGARLKGLRLFVDSLNRRHVEEAEQYMKNLAALVARLELEAKKRKIHE